MTVLATTYPPKRKPAKKERVFLRIVKGGLEPADPYAASKLRERGYSVNDVVSADLKKLRNPAFNRLVHRIGQLVVANIEAFAGMDAHAAVKRLQWESNTECDEVGISMRSAWEQFASAILRIDGMEVIRPALDVVCSMLPSDALLFVRAPRSLSFESMDEGRYRAAAASICRYLSVRYWPSVSPERIEQMAEVMVGE